MSDISDMWNHQIMKFRQWIEHKQSFHYWGIHSRCDGKDTFVAPQQNIDTDAVDDIHQMYTGRVDINGIEIYEGDIVNVYYGEIDCLDERVVDSSEYPSSWPIVSTVCVIGNVLETKCNLERYRGINLNYWRG